MVDEGSDPAAGPSPNQPEGVGPEPGPTPLLPRLWSAIREMGLFCPTHWLANRWVRRTALLVILVLLLVVMSQGIAHVRETEVGVQVDNLRGELALKERAGYHIHIPYLTTFYVLDKTIQRLDLSWRQGPGGVGRDLKLKTADGSNVSLDMVINFMLIPDKAAEVLRRSGPGTSFTKTWIEPFARHVCFSWFGQLTSEEMYDAAKRNERAQAAVKEMNEKLGPYGIAVVAVIPGEFRFYKEYEQVIQEKKLADQQVEEQQAQARSAEQDQIRQIVEATKKAETRLAAFEGECANRLIQAEAEANKMKREADGQYAATKLAADGAFYSDSQDAVGQKALLLSEAEGLEQMRKAMAGDGGLSMIGREYAKHLGSIRFSATPIARDPWIQQFAVQPSAAAAATVAPAKSSSAAQEGAVPSGGATPSLPPRSPPSPPPRGPSPNAPHGESELPRPPRPAPPGSSQGGVR